MLKKNAMEPILLEIQPGGCYVEDTPHQGEEFGYVMQGTIQVIHGNRKFKAKKKVTAFTISATQIITL